MSGIAIRTVLLVAALVVTLPAVAPAQDALVVDSVSWQTIGSMVEFHIRFHNTSPDTPSQAASGEVNSQPFGAFVDNHGLIGLLNIPVLQPDSFFDVFYEVSLSELPPSATKLMPGPGGAPGGIAGLAQPGCPPDPFWAGNIDIFWSGPGGSGQVNYHLGTIQVCPGAGPSYIHVIMDCPGTSGSGPSWSFSGVCSGWTVSLVSSDGFGMPDGPAPNPLPAGFWDGWICVSADGSVPVGATCCFDLDLTCDGQPATVSVCAESCEWEAVAVEPSTWSKIKALIRD